MRDFLMRSAAWAVLVTGLLVTLLAWRTVNARFEADRFTHFDGLVDSAADALVARLGLANLMKGAGRALFDASKEVERAEFRRFVRSLSSTVSARDTIMGFVELVHHPDRDDFLEDRRADGAPEFQILPEGNRPIYYPIKFVEPEQDTGTALGFDVATQPATRAAYEAALESGESAFFGPIDLLEDEPIKEPGFAMVLPIYRPGVSSPQPEGRRRLGRGWFYLAFHASDVERILVEALGERRHQVSLVFEGMHVDGESVPIWTDPIPPPHRGSLEERRSFEMAGISWALVARTSPRWIFAQKERDPRVLLVGGVVLSLALFTSVQILSRTRRRAESLAQAMTADLRNASEALLEQHATLARSNRLAAVGEVAAGMAHELRNPLAGIQMSLQNLLGELADPGHVERLEQVLAEMQRLTRLLNQQLETSRHEPEPLQRVDPAELVRDLLAIVRYQATDAIVLDAEVPPGLACMLPRDRMRQTLLNLILNAIEAMGDRTGGVRVTAERSDGRLRWIVSDDGPGFPEDLLASPVGPFVTHREGGTGLGLATVRRFVKDLDGELRLENRDGGGGRVVLDLPFAEE